MAPEGPLVPAVAVDRAEVEHVARLARLALDEEELARLPTELGAILAAVSKVSELDLTSVEPLSHPLALGNVLADDEPLPSLTVEEALANAPASDGAHFEVPPA